MNDRLSPWRKPGAEQLHTLLGGDPATDTVLTRIVEQLGLDECAALAGLVRNAFGQAMRDAGSTARHECLDAVQAVID
ncbi:MAG TPA: hypothetical protein VFZ85_10150, partial [Jiangellaceae bacterium]